MIKTIVDYLVSVASPAAGLKRQQARKIARGYRGGEPNRLTANNNPKNQSADSESQGPFGADSLRAWARMLVRDNPYAWSAVESIVSEVIGTGFGIQSALESPTGQDEEDTNENRDKTWAEWCEVCDINGQLTFDEIQVLAFREMVEAGECLLHYVTVPKVHNGIHRPVPLAIELIEADRLASDFDTYAFSRDRTDGKRITRGVEMDKNGRPIAYWVYPAHPTEPNVFRRTPERIPADKIKHLFRKDRIGQSRGVTWFAPIVEPLRSLGTYTENEMQASAVASCFTAAIKTETPIDMGSPPSTDTDTVDSDGNNYQFLQPGMILNLRPGESLESANPGRPNSNAGPWIALMVQGIAAGIGTSYEGVSKDFSNTSYSSSRTSKLENRPRYRRWQHYWKHHLCLETWDRFCNAAAVAGRKEFPTMVELLADRRVVAPVDVMPPVWEWVDVNAEQQSSEASVNAFQSTLQDELGGKGKNWRRVLYQAAKEKELKAKLGLVSTGDATKAGELAKQETAEAAQVTADAANIAAKSKPRQRNCGTGEGGFKPGNNCSDEGGGNSSNNYSTKDKNPENLTPLNDVEDQGKLDAIKEGMEKDGWTGRPILAVEGTGEALTGSHRIFAARETETQVPTLEITSDQMEFEVDGETLGEALSFAVDDDDRGSVLSAFSKQHTELSDASKLMNEEIESNERVLTNG